MGSLILLMEGASSTSCDNAPWWTAPVIVGGSGGSGTRGVVLLLEQLGVRMACINGPKPLLLNASTCNMTCNSAADCKLLSSFRTTSPYQLSFLHANHTRTLGGARACGADEALLRQSLDTPSSNGCGGTKAQAMRLVQSAVLPQYRRPLRWGMKNPHATYFANAWRQLFPCMVMVNTVRDLSELARGMKHFYSRVQEAHHIGYISQAAAESLTGGRPSKRILRAALAPPQAADDAARGRRANTAAASDTKSLERRSGGALVTPRVERRYTPQSFYVEYVRRVNLGLARWATICLPSRIVHLPLQRIVTVSRRSPACLDQGISPLVEMLRLDRSEALLAARLFVNSSFDLVERSILDTQSKALFLPPSINISWPQPLEPSACRGPLL